MATCSAARRPLPDYARDRGHPALGSGVRPHESRTPTPPRGVRPRGARVRPRGGPVPAHRRASSELVDDGLPLSVLIPIAPDMLFTDRRCPATTAVAGDVPYVGRRRGRRAARATSRRRRAADAPSAAVATAVAAVPTRPRSDRSTAVVVGPRPVRVAVARRGGDDRPTGLDRHLGRPASRPLAARRRSRRAAELVNGGPAAVGGQTRGPPHRLGTRPAPSRHDRPARSHDSGLPRHQGHDNRLKGRPNAAPPSKAAEAGTCSTRPKHAAQQHQPKHGSQKPDHATEAPLSGSTFEPGALDQRDRFGRSPASVRCPKYGGIHPIRRAISSTISDWERIMSAEHKRPLVAFVLVALVCSSTVGQAVRSALLGNGIGLGILIPIAPAHLLDTIEASRRPTAATWTPRSSAPRSAPSATSRSRPRADAGAAEPQPEYRSRRRRRRRPRVAGAWSRSSPPAPSTATGARGTSRATSDTRLGSTSRALHDVGSPPSGARGPDRAADSPRRPAGGPGLRHAGQSSGRCRRPASSRCADRAQGTASCGEQVDDAEEAADPGRRGGRHRSATSTPWSQHLLGAIAAVGRPGRASGDTDVHARRVDDAPRRSSASVRRAARARMQRSLQATSQDQWSDALSAYAQALRARPARPRTRTADQRLRQVRAYAKDRQATVAQDPARVRSRSSRSGHVAAARRVPQARPGRPGEARTARSPPRIDAERDRAAAAYETADRSRQGDAGHASAHGRPRRELEHAAEAADDARAGQGRAHDQGADRCRRARRDRSPTPRPWPRRPWWSTRPRCRSTRCPPVATRLVRRLTRRQSAVASSTSTLDRRAVAPPRPAPGRR